MNQDDTDIVEKAKNTMAKIVLAFIVAPLAITATVWLFSTVVATSQALTLVSDGMNRMVHAVENNTIAVNDMKENNALGHSEMSLMIYEVKENIAVGQLRLGRLERDCDENHDQISEHTNGNHK